MHVGKQLSSAKVVSSVPWAQQLGVNLYANQRFTKATVGTRAAMMAATYENGWRRLTIPDHSQLGASMYNWQVSCR